MFRRLRYYLEDFMFFKVFSPLEGKIIAVRFTFEEKNELINNIVSQCNVANIICITSFKFAVIS